ncbi:MAG: hypothetical protein V4633_09875 [Pseudomonadota bacterium]
MNSPNTHTGTGTIREIGLVFDDLQRHLSDVVNDVQDAKEIRTKSFEQTEILGQELTRHLKGHEFLPRFVLRSYHRSIGALENSAKYMPDPQEVANLVASLQTTFYLILDGECHADRIPGKPRIFQ